MGIKLEDLISEAERQGWVVEPTKSGFMFRPADRSQTPYAVHRDPPEYTLKRIVSQLRRRGLVHPPQKGTP